MKYFLATWPNNSVTIVGAVNFLELFDLLGELGNPFDAEIQHLPTVPFAYDSTSGFDERLCNRKKRLVDPIKFFQRPKRKQ